MKKLIALTALVLMTAVGSASAAYKVGLLSDLTGPTSSVGVPYAEGVKAVNPDAKIVLSNELDELSIWQILTQIGQEAARNGLDADRLLRRLAPRQGHPGAPEHLVPGALIQARVQHLGGKRGAENELRRTADIPATGVLPVFLGSGLGVGLADTLAKVAGPVAVVDVDEAKRDRAARLGAATAEHLLYLSPEGAARLAARKPKVARHSVGLGTDTATPRLQAQGSAGQGATQPEGGSG